MKKTQSCYVAAAQHTVISPAFCEEDLQAAEASENERREICEAGLLRLS